MEHFDWTQFTRKIAVKSTLQEIYNAWTTGSGIERWFLRKATFKNTKGVAIGSGENVSAGYRYEWSWFLYDVTEHGTITKANGKDHLQFTFAGDCLVDVRLSEKAGHIIVALTQSNIPTDDTSKKQYRLGCDTGWSFYLVNLKSIYEGGLDLRNKQEKLKGMLDA